MDFTRVMIEYLLVTLLSLSWFQLAWLLLCGITALCVQRRAFSPPTKILWTRLNDLPSETKGKILRVMDLSDFLRFRSICWASHEMAAFWAASVVQDLGAATGIKTAAVLFLRSAGSSPSSHLVRSTIRRYYIARSLAEYLADDQLSRLHLHDTTLAANLVKGLVPYLLLLMHFFETYRARVANFIKDPDNADYFNGNTARRPMQSPIIETDILKGLYRQENISHLYTVYTWLLKILDWKRSYGSSITNYQEIFLLCGLEPVRDAIRISYGRSRKAYVEAQIQLAKQGSTPSGSLLTVLDIATAKTLIRMSHGSAGFPSIRNRIALGLPRRQDKEDMDLQTTRDGFLAVLESRDWAEQDLLV